MPCHESLTITHLHSTAIIRRLPLASGVSKLGKLWLHSVQIGIDACFPSHSGRGAPTLPFGARRKPLNQEARLGKAVAYSNKPLFQGLSKTEPTSNQLPVGRLHNEDMRVGKNAYDSSTSTAIFHNISRDMRFQACKKKA